GLDDLTRRNATETADPFGRARDSGTPRRPSSTSCDWPSNVFRGKASHAIGLGAWAGNGRTAVMAAAPASTNPPNRFIPARIPEFGICTHTQGPAAGFRRDFRSWNDEFVTQNHAQTRSSSILLKGPFFWRLSRFFLASPIAHGRDSAKGVTLELNECCRVAPKKRRRMWRVPAS